MQASPIPGQIWMTRPWALRTPRIRLLRVVAVTPATVTYITHQDEMAGRPIVRRSGRVTLRGFMERNILHTDVV